MRSFEEEDERVSLQRAARRTRQMWTAPQAESPLERRETAAARGPQSGRFHCAAADENGGFDGAETRAEGMVVTPEPASGRRRRTTSSVSFSEPVETPQPPRKRDKQTLAKATADEPFVPPRRSRNRLETRLAELQRDVANLSLRLRASSTASQRSVSLHDENTAELSLENENGFAEENQNGSRGREQPPPQAREEEGENYSRRGGGGERRAKSPARTILKKAAEPRGKSPSQRGSHSKSRAREDDKENQYVPENGVRCEDEAQRLRVRSSGAGGGAAAAGGGGGGGGGGGAGEPPRSAKEMLRVVRELRVVAVERDQLKYDLDQTKRALAAMEKKHADAAKWKDAYDKMKRHCDSLQESLDLSEKIRVRQKRLLQQLQQSVKQDEEARAARAALRPTATARPHRVDVLESVLHDRTTGDTSMMHQPRRGGGGGGGGISATRTTAGARAPERSPTTRAAPKAAVVNTSARSYSRSDFDSLLQVPLPDRSMAGSTVVRRAPQQTRDSHHNASTQQTVSARSRVAAVTATSTSRAAKAAPAATTRTNHFLAPTQASMNHAAKRRPDTVRRPFVV